MLDSTYSIKTGKETGTLRPERANGIINKAADKSAILAVAPRTKMSISGNEFFVRTERPEADIIGEGEAKPVGGFKHGILRVQPQKAATIVTWSEERRHDDPEGVFNDLAEELSSAIARQIDLLAIHGKSAKSGAAVPGVVPLSSTANQVKLGSAKVADGGLAQDLISGIQMVDDADGDFNGLISDRSLRLQYLSARDTLGRPLHASNVDVTARLDSVLGVPNTYSRAVRGDVGANKDSGIRAIGGDFENSMRIGFVQDISIRMSNEATLVDGDQVISLWQRNLEAALVECIFGFVIFDTNKFVKYVK